MSVIKSHVGDSAPGIVGSSAAGGFTVFGFIADSIPILQAISLLVGIAVAVITFIYYWRKVKKGE
jgi:hypothetical protein